MTTVPIRPSSLRSLLVLTCAGFASIAIAFPARGAAMDDITAGMELIDEIDTAQAAPVYESEPGASQTGTILGRGARFLPPGEKASLMAYVIGKGKGLKAGHPYVLTIEYPDDVSRTIYMANRGADYSRGWATGMAIGDSRSQFVEPCPESLAYPQTGEWQTYRQFFHLLDRFQGVKSVRDPEPRCRPYGPADGFHVVIFQVRKLNDPRSEGAAVGRIRLYDAGDASKLYAPVQHPPEGLPRRRTFWREEMADEAIRGQGEDSGADPVAWYRGKARMAKILGIQTFSKDLLEFGYNQGWESDDLQWVLEAQPPLRDLWTKLVPAIAAEGLEIIPYYEYKGGIGTQTGNSLARQRRAHKLYHGIKGERYTGVWNAERHNADLTDPETLEDAKRLLDKTVVRFKDQAKFPGIWLRTRDCHLPVSFSEAAIGRFKEDHAGDAEAQSAGQEALIASYEGDKVLYNRYLDWWFGKRAQFLTSLRDYLREQLGQKEAQVLFTPWVVEAIPQLRVAPANFAGVITDDSPWWKAYAETMPDSWWKWHMMPIDYDTLVEKNLYGASLAHQRPVSSNGDEPFHSAPVADPERYKSIEDVMMTYPIGRLFTVSNPEPLEEYRAASGLTVAKFYTLNENAADPKISPAPFDGVIGYVSVDCDRAGPHLMLEQTRAVANGDPRNIAYLSGSSFSTGFPEVMRRFNQAFLAVPALPSRRLEGAADAPEVVVREIPTSEHGTYYYVANTSMHRKRGVKVSLPGEGTLVNLVTGESSERGELELDLDSGELLAYRRTKTASE